MTIQPVCDQEPRIRVDREVLFIRSGTCRPIVETILIMNDGRGHLTGSVSSDSSWITVLTPLINTKFIQCMRVRIQTDMIPRGSVSAEIRITTNGGSLQIPVKSPPHPDQRTRLLVKEKSLRFCVQSGNGSITGEIIVTNAGDGILSGTASSQVPWITIQTGTIYTRTVQVIAFTIDVSSSPPARHPVGFIRIRTNGGEELVEISIHFTTRSGSGFLINPPRIRVPWQAKGIIEQSVTITHLGNGILRGTIPSPKPWIRVVPPIFSTDNRQQVILRIDTRQIPEGGICTETFEVITNTGRKNMILDLIPPNINRRVNVIQKAGSPPVRTGSVIRRYRKTRKIVAYDGTGIRYYLISTGRSGGEGELFSVGSQDHLYGKIFHPHRVSPELIRKLEAMCNNPLPSDIRKNITWPLAILYEKPGSERMIGYLMNRLPSDRYYALHHWYDPEDTSGSCSWSFQTRLKVVAGLAGIVEALHLIGHCVGDLRENNLLASLDGDIVLIDTDSFQIRDGKSGSVYYTRVATGEYLPPELLEAEFQNMDCDRRYADRFALAVLIFRIFMNGVHPFQAKGPLVYDAPTTVDKMKLGIFAFDSRTPGISPPDFAPSFETIPRSLRDMFRESFVRTYRTPKNRPEPGCWVDVCLSLLNSDKRSVIMINTGRSDLLTDEKDRSVRMRSSSHRYIGGDGVACERGKLIFRVTGGEIFDIRGKKGIQIYIPDNEAVIPVVLFPNGIHSGNEPLISPLSPVSLSSEGGKCIGYEIPEIDPARYVYWHIAADRESNEKRYHGSFSFRHRVAAARNLASALLRLERLGYEPITLTPRSVFVGPDASVRLFAYPIRKKIKDLPAYGSDPYHNYPAILIFQMLMEGYHPFQGKGGPDSCRSPEDRMKEGLYPYNRSGLIIPPDAVNFDVLPKSIQILFSRSFECGPENSWDVPPVKEWFTNLDRVYHSLKHCDSDIKHWYQDDMSSCPWCGNKLLFSASSLLLLSDPGFIPFLPMSSSRMDQVYASSYQITPGNYSLIIPDSAGNNDEYHNYQVCFISGDKVCADLSVIHEMVRLNDDSD